MFFFLSLTLQQQVNGDKIKRDRKEVTVRKLPSGGTEINTVRYATQANGVHAAA